MRIYRTAAVAALLAGCLVSVGHARGSSVASRLLEAHNSERRLVGAAPLAWDARLAAMADSYALHLARTNRWGHSPPNQRAGQGENLWMGSRGSYAVDDMAAAWSMEKKVFRAGQFPNVSRTGSWHDVAHYTQMVWPGTTSVGCSVRSSAQWDYLVCRYARAGNVIGQRVGPTRLARRP